MTQPNEPVAVSPAFAAGTTGPAGSVASRRQSPPSPDYSSLPAIEMHSHIHDTAGIELMRQERLEFALIMHTDNQVALDAARANTDLLGALAWLNPTQHGWLDEARMWLAKYPDVLKGFKLHPEMGSYKASLDLLGGLFELANKHGLMIQSHTGGLPPEGTGNCNCALFQPILAAFPQTNFIAIHGWPADEAFALVRSYPNVYIDTSYTAWGAAYQKRALTAVGKERIVMGLDSPLGFPTKDGELQPHFRDAIGGIACFYDHDPAAVAHIMYRNARRILRLPEPSVR